MAREFGQTQLYVDTAYIREELQQIGIDPRFGPTELLRPLLNLRIEGKTLAIRRTIFYDAIDHQSSAAQEKINYREDQLFGQASSTRRYVGETRNRQGHS